MLLKRERIILYFTLGLIGFSLMLNFIFLPVINEFGDLNKEITLCQLNLKKSIKLLSRKQKIQQDYTQISSLTQLEAGEEEIITLVLAQLENLASQAGLRIIDIRPQASRDLDRYKEIVVELKQEGKIEGFLRFIYDLENPPHLLRIKKLQLNSKAAGGVLEGQLLVSKIYLPFEKP
ncbi:MAG: type 4a pilus biogenesis protein PilO [Candidatus Omnitrophota bacterium]